MSKFTISQATDNTIQNVAPLFDEYRQFYGQPADLERARSFLKDRLARGESVIFLATQGDRAVGFAQLYPSFSSLSMSRIWILSDLFVSTSSRKQGVATALLEECKRLAIHTGAKELTLETMKSNLTAQRLYERCGWKRDDIFYTYHLVV